MLSGLIRNMLKDFAIIRQCAISLAILCSLFLKTAVAEIDILPSITVSASNLRVSLDKTTTLASPTDIAPIPDGSGRMLVTEAYSGKIQLLDSQGQLLNTYHNRLNSNSFAFVFNDVAYSSIAFHPGFADSSSLGYKKFYALEPETPTAGTADFTYQFGSGTNHQAVLYEYTVGDTSANTIGSFAKREKLFE